MCPSGFTDRVGGGDCDDNAVTGSDVFPGATEIIGDGIDQSCDGGEICYLDADNDSYRSTDTTVSADADCADPTEAEASAGLDCDDGDNAILPGATELAGDEVDQNCDSLELCYDDVDNDGYRTTGTRVSNDIDCDSPGEARAVEPSGDCDDGNASIRPGVSEIAGDEVDQNCNGTELCYLDNDNDGFRPGSGTSTILSSNASCTDNREARATEPTGDCNDSNSAIKPGAAETIGDQIDYNCDGDELCYADADNDNYRTNTSVVSSDLDCVDTGEATAAQASGDCVDGNAAINPGAAEYCDTVDQDCDGSPRNGCPASSTLSSFLYTSWSGGSSGTIATDPCPTGQAITAMRIWHDGSLIRAVQTSCREIVITEDVGTPYYTYHTHAGNSSTPQTTIGVTGGYSNVFRGCPLASDGHPTFLTALNLRVGARVDQLGFVCSDLRWPHTTPVPWSGPNGIENEYVSGVGGSGGSAVTNSCPTSRRVGQTMRYRYDSSGIVAMSIGCMTPGYTAQ